MIRRLSVLAFTTQLSCGIWPTACEFKNNGEYYCWKTNTKASVKAATGFNENTSKELGYTYHCTADEVAPEFKTNDRCRRLRPSQAPRKRANV